MDYSDADFGRDVIRAFGETKGRNPQQLLESILQKTRSHGVDDRDVAVYIQKLAYDDAYLDKYLEAYRTVHKAIGQETKIESTKELQKHLNGLANAIDQLIQKNSAIRAITDRD